MKVTQDQKKEIEELYGQFHAALKDIRHRQFLIIHKYHEQKNERGYVSLLKKIRNFDA